MMTPEQRMIRDELWDDVTEVIDVGRYRHGVVFIGDNAVYPVNAFCNSCGSMFITGDKCAGCGQLTEEHPGASLCSLGE